MRAEEYGKDVEQRMRAGNEDKYAE